MTQSTYAKIKPSLGENSICFVSMNVRPPGIEKVSIGFIHGSEKAFGKLDPVANLAINANDDN